MARTVALAPGLVVLLLAGPAAALSHDLDLSRMVLDNQGQPWDGRDPYNSLFDYSDSSQFHPLANQDYFRQLAAEVGLAFAPKFMSPAETLGHLGFDVSVQFSVSDIHEQEPYWTGPCGGRWATNCRVSSYIEDDDVPNPVLSSGQLHIRKGLPFSFEVGGTAEYLFYTSMAALGLELKWAFNEGLKYVPDFAVRGSVVRVFGSHSLDLTLGGFDISISKAFGLADAFELTPYAGYAMTYIRAASYVLDATPTISPGTTEATLSRPAPMPSNFNEDLDGNGTVNEADWRQKWEAMSGSARDEFLKSSTYPDAYKVPDPDDPSTLVPGGLPIQTVEDRMYFSFDAEGLVAHRPFLGLRLKVSIVTLGAEMVFASVPQADISFAWQLSFKFGLDF